MSFTQSLSKKQILKKKTEFNLFFRKAKRIDSAYIRVFYTPKQNNTNRFAFGVNKKIGNAVVRNKVKRRLKEFVRMNLNTINSQFDLYFSCKTAIKTLSYSTLTKQLAAILGKKDLIKK